MCGITAISANKEALPFLLQGLEKLEYRGYDSAGITTIEGNHLFTKKAKGRLQNLKDFGSKMLVIPCTSIKEDSPEATEYELDIRAKIRKYPIRSRMQLSDMRVVDLQRLDIRKRFCNVITDKKEIENHIKHIIFDEDDEY